MRSTVTGSSDVGRHLVPLNMDPTGSVDSTAAHHSVTFVSIVALERQDFKYKLIGFAAATTIIVTLQSASDSPILCDVWPFTLLVYRYWVECTPGRVRVMLLEVNWVTEHHYKSASTPHSQDPLKGTPPYTPTPTHPDIGAMY